MTRTESSPEEREALLRARARRLTDPLGAKGFRRTRARVETERTARRTVFVGTLAAFAGLVGLVGLGAKPGESQTPPGVVAEAQVAGVPANQLPTDTSRFHHASAVKATTAATSTKTHKRTRSS